MNRNRIKQFSKLLLAVFVVSITISNLNTNFSSEELKYSLKTLKALAWETSEQEDKLVGIEEEYDSWLHDDIDIAMAKCGMWVVDVLNCNELASDRDDYSGKYYTGRDAGSVTLNLGVVSGTYNIKDCDPGGSNC